MEKIDTIIKALKAICNANELNATPDMVLDCATRIYVTGVINRAKQGAKQGSNDLGATDKQLATLKNLYVEFKEGISKKEASDLISKKIDSFNQ